MTDRRSFVPILNDYSLDAVEESLLQRLKDLYTHTSTLLCDVLVSSSAFLMPCLDPQLAPLHQMMNSYVSMLLHTSLLS